ncbi:MAG: hypothetical protein IJ960_05665 [Oscillospiraceae bacterium]|nr:hypothetical protein [Oscillospiraceae bacterium]
MKKYLCLTALLLVLPGCALDQGELDQALAFRQTLTDAERICFDVGITADYGDRVERFTLRCDTDQEGAMSFTVLHPAEISGITGSVTGQQGSLTFEDTVLAFPLLAQDRLSPVSGPWVLVQALKEGYITSCAREGEFLRLTVNDSYDADPLTLEIWIRENTVTAAEIGWRGMRQMTMEIDNFSLV